MAISQRAPTKKDVDLAEVKRKGEVQTRYAYGIVGALWIAVSSLPILALQEIVEPLAGNTTIVDVNLVFSITIALSVIANGAQYFKGRSQRAELRRQRERFDALEREVER